MRKLLVASQKSGVGKTTTAINLAAGAAMAGARVLLVETDPLNNISCVLNLAQHAERKPLRESGIELPGVLCSGVHPRMDVFSPYEEGGCNDDDLDRLLQLLSLDAFKESYDCLIVNAPPFFGGRSAPLLASCDEFIVIMQAEPLAYRTMPAFLEMVQRASQEEPHSAKMRGILLTLPESESPGGRWERELRGRFGGRVLSQVIPYDEEVGKSSLFGQIALQANPESPASVSYRDLVGELQLTRDAKKAVRPLEATLTVAAAAVRAKPFEPRTTKPTKRRSSARIPRVRVPVPVSTSGGNLPGDGHGDEMAALSPSAALERQLPPPPAIHRSSTSANRDEPRTAPRNEQVPVTPRLHSTQRPWLVWVGLAMAMGIGLRFVELPSFAVPIVVGIAVTAAMTLFLHLAMQAGEERSRLATTSPPNMPPTPKPLSGPHKKLPPTTPRSTRRQD